MFGGSMVAMVTPFKNGDVDYQKLGELVEFHIKNGTNALVPCGTTGESPTLSHEEHERVVAEVIQKSAGRIPVVAGTGSNSTREALHLTKAAKKAGADGVLMITPYYNKPEMEGMYQHFKTIHDEVDIPIILYNVPSRTGRSITPETVARLAELKNVVAIKEASGSMDQASEILSLCDITILSGDDSLTLPLMALGGKGIISVAANIVPKDVAAMTDAFSKGDIETARQMHYKLFPIFRNMFIETNPIPVKSAMRILGLLNGEMRLPLSNISEANEAKLRKVLQDYGLEVK